MSQKRIAAKELMMLLLASNVLTQDQAALAQTGRLPVTYDELYHRAFIPVSGSATGVAAYDETLEKEFGVTNLEKTCKVPADFIITHVRTRVGIATVASGSVSKTPATIKVTDFNNKLQINGANQTVRVPQALLNSEWILKVDDAKQFGMSIKNFFLDNNRKDVIEASLEDCIAVPNSLIFVKKGKALRPNINLPQGVSLPTTDSGITDIGYIIETTYLGYTVGTV